MDDKGTSESGGTAVSVKLSDLGFHGEILVRDLWKYQNLTPVDENFASLIPWHGAGLYRLHQK